MGIKNCALVNPAHNSTSKAKSHGIGKPTEVSQGPERGVAPCPHENYRGKKRRKEDIGLIGDMVRTKKQVKDIGPQDLDHDTIVQ